MMHHSAKVTRRLLLGGAVGAVAGVADTASAEGQIRQLIAKYAAAADGADTALAGEVWMNSPDVSLIYPLGHLQGWDAVKRDLYEKAMGGMFSERKLNIRDIVVHAYDDCGWAEFSWTFDAKMKSTGAAIETNGRETQIYRKGADRWALVHVHYSEVRMPKRSATS
jgi:ketosteroid isomerase-like protein